MKNITFLITVYDASLGDITRWIEFYKKNNSSIDVYFLLDNPNYQYRILLEEYISKEYLHINEENIGKFRTIMNFISMDIIKTSHFKVIDPDDYVSVILLENIDKQLINEKSIYLLNSTITRRKHWENEQSVFEFINKKQVDISTTFANRWTIYPTSILKDQKVYSKNNRIDSSDDKLLGYICIFSGANIGRVDSNFYLYINNLGESSVDNFSKFISSEQKTYAEIMSLKKDSKYKDITDYDPTINWYKKRARLFRRSRFYFKLNKEEKKRFKEEFSNLIELIKEIWKL